MTALLDRARTSRDGPGAKSTQDRLPAPVRVRRPVLAVASVAVVFTSIAVFVGIYSDTNHQVAVITVAQPVLQGQRITSGDLGEAHLTTSGALSPVPVAEARDVVGKVATVTLVPGSMLTMADVSASQPIKPGDAVVGIALKDGQLPSAGVEPGDEVMVVQTETPGSPAPDTPASSPTGVGATGSSQAGTTSSGGSVPEASAAGSPGNPTGVLVPDALVFGVASPGPNSSGSASELVSIEVSSTVAAAVSVAAASDQVSLVLLPASGTGS